MGDLRTIHKKEIRPKKGVASISHESKAVFVDTYGKNQAQLYTAIWHCGCKLTTGLLSLSTAIPSQSTGAPSPWPPPGPSSERWTSQRCLRHRQDALQFNRASRLWTRRQEGPAWSRQHQVRPSGRESHMLLHTFGCGGPGLSSLSSPREPRRTGVFLECPQRLISHGF